MPRRGPYKPINQEGLAELCGVSRSTVAAVLQGKRDDEFAGVTLKRVRRIAKREGYQLLRYERLEERQNLGLQVRILLRKPDSLAILRTGTATLANLSSRGICLRQVQLKPRDLPNHAFVVEVKTSEHARQQSAILGTPVRMRFVRGGLELGLLRDIE